MAEEAEQMRSQIQSLSAGIDGVPDVATEMIKQAKRAGPEGTFTVLYCTVLCCMCCIVL